MFLADTHVHSTVSHDASSTMDEVLKTAISLNLSHINITDHIDHIYGETENASVANMRNYILEAQKIKEKYSKQIYFGVGLEVTYCARREPTIKKMVALPGLEYVIQSVHDVKERDCYYQDYFEGRTKAVAYNEFLDEVISSLNSDYRFDAIGHLTYITRTAPYADKSLNYEDFKTHLDKIISLMLKKDVILEFNTNTYSTAEGCLPGFDIATAFYNAGGKKVTLSSDAHNCRDIARSFSFVTSNLKKIGFKGITVKENGEHILLPF